jgi:hypothetical protein
VLLLLGAAPSLASTPTPTPSSSMIVVYTGTGISTNSAYPEFAKDAIVLPTTATVDCTASPCTILSTVTDTSSGNIIYDLTDGTKIPLVRGRASAQIVGHSDALCVDGEVPPGEFGATASGDTITITFVFGHLADQTCADGSSAHTVDGFVYTAKLTAPAGTGCLATHTCRNSVPAPAASSLALPAAATGPLRVAPHAIQLADRSTLSTLPTTRAAFSVANVAWAVAATVVLALLIAFPSHLLNSATEAGTDRLSEWWASRRRRIRALRKPEAAAETASTPSKPVNFAGWPLAAAGVLAASLISSFVNPSLGLNPASLRVFLSILVSFLLDAVAGWFLLILFVRRAMPSATARFHFAPASLVIVLVAVLFTRITGFAPGIVFGLVAGVAFGAIAATADKARHTMISLGYSFVLAIIGWAGYSAIAETAGAHPAAWIVFVQETLSSMAIGGLAALPIVLVPVRGMAGHVIWSWNRWIWGSSYVVGLFGFFVVLMPKPFSWATVGLSVWTWIGLYLAYAITAVVLWLIITRPWKKDEEKEQAPAVQLPDAVPGS